MTDHDERFVTAYEAINAVGFDMQVSQKQARKSLEDLKSRIDEILEDLVEE